MARLIYVEDDERVDPALRAYFRARRIRVNRENAARFVIRRVGRRIAVNRRSTVQARRASARFAIRSAARRALMRRFYFLRRFRGAAAAA